MSPTLAVDAGPVVADPPRSPVWWRVLAWLLVVGWVLVLAVVVLAGEQQATRYDLREDVRAGRAHQVSAEFYSPGRRGPVTVHWRTSPISGYHARIGAQQLRALDVEVVRHERPAGVHARLLGREVRGGAWLLGGGLGLLLATFALLGTSPRLWRATYWGWFWPILLLPPLGPLAYLVLGGATGAVGPPREQARRLTGGWSFLLCVVVGSALGSG